MSVGSLDDRYPAYLNFCREAWKKAKRFHDQTLAREVMVIDDKWVARELKRPVLEALRKETLRTPDVRERREKGTGTKPMRHRGCRFVRRVGPESIATRIESASALTGRSRAVALA